MWNCHAISIFIYIRQLHFCVHEHSHHCSTHTHTHTHTRTHMQFQRSTVTLTLGYGTVTKYLKHKICTIEHVQ
jgi:hypothetical protein